MRQTSGGVVAFFDADKETVVFKLNEFVSRFFRFKKSDMAAKCLIGM